MAFPCQRTRRRLPTCGEGWAFAIDTGCRAVTDEEQGGVPAGMDRFTRNYLIVLGVIAALVLGAWVASWDWRAGDINALLEDDPLVASYPYSFRVLAVENGVARVSSPRSYEVPVMRFLAVIRPELHGKAQDAPEMMAAQADLVKVQKRVEQIVRGQPDVRSVRWVLDRQWYSDRGISP